MKFSGAEITIKLLEAHGVNVVSGIPGGFNLPLYDALYKSKIKHILGRHEQGCGFIAQGMARSSGKTSVCIATSGPGVTNLLTAIADAKLDSIPMIAITGQVPLASIGTDSFQEIDTYGLTVPITKHNFLVRSVEELLKIIPESFRIASSGRPGPIVVDIPKNVQQQILEFDDEDESSFFSRFILCDHEKASSPNIKYIETIANKINSSSKPILYIGGGVVASGGEALIKELAEKNNIPVATTLMGIGCFPQDNPLSLGMLGMHGSRYTNKIMYETDLLIALGVRLDDRAIGNVEKFCPHASIVHIDIDDSEINKIKQSDISITGDIKEVLEKLIPRVDIYERRDWCAYIKKMKRKHPFIFSKTSQMKHPIEYIRLISKIVGPDVIVTTDVGQHQMWVAQAYPVLRPRMLLTSGGLGTMGFGLPAAIGAAIENPDKKIICISGDGSILMNIQELATLADFDLNVKVIILNNGHLGLVRQQQELFYDANYIASKFPKISNYAAIAEGFGIKGYDLSKASNMAEVLEVALNEKGPVLLDIPIYYKENVFPMVPPGKGNHEMIGGECIE